MDPNYILVSLNVMNAPVKFICNGSATVLNCCFYQSALTTSHCHYTDTLSLLIVEKLLMVCKGHDLSQGM